MLLSVWRVLNDKWMLCRHPVLLPAFHASPNTQTRSGCTWWCYTGLMQSNYWVIVQKNFWSVSCIMKKYMNFSNCLRIKISKYYLNMDSKCDICFSLFSQTVTSATRTPAYAIQAIALTHWGAIAASAPMASKQLGTCRCVSVSCATSHQSHRCSSARW